MHLKVNLPVLGEVDVFEKPQKGHYRWRDVILNRWRDCNPVENKIIQDAFHTVPAFEFLVADDHRGFFSTYEKAHAWKVAYITEFPMVSRIGWEIKSVKVRPGTEMDLPMNYKRKS